MSQWHRIAMEMLPAKAQTAKAAQSLHDLWFTLLVDFQDAYRKVPPDQELIEQIWAFAKWCYAPGRHKFVRGAVAASFFEHLPHFGPARREMPARLTQQQLAELEPYFKVTLRAIELDAFHRELRVWHREHRNSAAT